MSAGKAQAVKAYAVVCANGRIVEGAGKFKSRADAEAHRDYLFLSGSECGPHTVAAMPRGSVRKGR